MRRVFWKHAIRKGWRWLRSVFDGVGHFLTIAALFGSPSLISVPSLGLWAPLIGVAVSPPNICRSTASGAARQEHMYTGRQCPVVCHGYARSVRGRPNCGKTLVSGKPVIAAMRSPLSVKTMRP
jgi:hypothetical protein